MNAFLHSKKQLFSFLTILFISYNCFAGGGDGPQNQGVELPELVFKNPQLIKGVDKKDGATYYFQNVASGIDATIQITKRSSPNVIVYALDVNNTGWDKAFQPQVGIKGGIPSNSVYWMEFELKFYKAGSKSMANISKFHVTALDVDGDAVSVKEFVQFENVDSVRYSSFSYLKNDSPLDVNSDGIVNDVSGGIKNLTGYNLLSQGPVYNGVNIDTSNTAYMATYTYINKNDIKFIVGAKNGNMSLIGTGPAHLAATPVPDITQVDSSATSQFTTDPGLRLNSLWFKTFSLAPVIVNTLPVKLESFTAAYDKTSVLLQWKVADQENFSHFVLERSTDGKSFKDVAVIFAKEANDTPDYLYKDKSYGTASGTLYYRLRMVDNTQEYTYSSVRVVRLSNDSPSAAALNVYPNPASDQVRVTLPESWVGKSVIIQLFTGNGVKVRAVQVNTASQTESMELKGLSTGFYVVQATCGTEHAQQHIIKN